MPKAGPEQPVGASDRILALDVLRGFAMLGVLIAYCMWSLGTAPEASWTPLDRKLDEAAAFLVDGKFYTILAFLFGLGFSIQVGRASDDSAAVETYCRRLAALAAIGLLHALLLRNGDILLPYALTGFLLIPFRRASDRILIFSALAILFAEAVLRAFWTDVGLPPLDRPKLENAPYLVENAEWVRYWYRTALFSWPINLTMFLLGFCAGRGHLLMELAARPRKLLLIALGGLAAGTALYLARMELLGAMRSSDLANSLAWLLYTSHCWGLSSAYAALLLLALRTGAGAAALRALAAVGRLALTNYLMQAAIIVPVCIAFGLFDRFTATSSLALAAALFLIVQLPFSIIWTRHFQFGPAEWIWRLLTYHSVPALRLSRGQFASL